MELHEVSYTDAAPVDGYGPGFFRVGGVLHHGPVLLMPDRWTGWQGWDDPAPVVVACGDLDVLFCGMGDDIANLPNGLRADLEAAGAGVEVMNSPAAARTYNVLIAEGRRVGAALIPVGAS